MKVVQLWYSPTAAGGGGGLAMNRLHTGLLGAGVDSRILCWQGPEDDPTIDTVPSWPWVERPLRLVTKAVGLNDIHRISSWSLPRHEFYRSADVAHFHGLHSSFLSYLALPWLTRHKPAVLTLHDMWPLTGHCAFNFDCDRWLSGCGSCPHMDAHPAVKRDATDLEWRLKRWSYQRSTVAVIAVSSEFARRARQGLLSHFPVYHVPNGVDVDTFKPVPTAEARHALGVPQDKRVLMFSAIDITQRHKGADLLADALLQLPPSVREASHLLLVGNGAEQITQRVPIPATGLGFVADKATLALAYSASDLFLLPSRSEPFGQVLLESIACGTPGVAFAVGGIPDIISHGETGLLVTPEHPVELAAGITDLLTHEERRVAMGQRCRAVAVERFSADAEMRSHLEIYGALQQGEL